MEEAPCLTAIEWRPNFFSCESNSLASTHARKNTVVDMTLRSISTLPKRSLAAGEILVEENTATGALYFLASGTVEVLKGGV